MKKWTLILLLCLCLNLIAHAQNTGLRVDAGQTIGEVSPLSYGVSHSPWGFVDISLMPAAENAGITFIRFPGGHWIDSHDLSTDILDRFMVLAEQMGAEVGLNVRLLDGSPEAAAELVRYANQEKDYDIRYWFIGNEPNLFDDYTTEQFNRDWRAIAEAMLAVDPTIQLIGPEISQYPPNFEDTPKDPEGRDWMTEFLRANGDLVNIVSVHRYPFPRNIQAYTTIEDMRQNPPEWDLIIPNLRALTLEITGEEKPIAITEINSHWSKATGGEASPDSFYNAIWFADVLGRIISQEVAIVAYWQLQSNSRTGGWGLMAAYDLRPTYYVYQLYQRFGSQLKAATSSESDVSIYAAQHDDQTLTLMVVNLSAEAKTLPLTIEGFAEATEAELWRFDAEHNAENLGLVSLDEGLTLPGQSISLYIVSP